MGAGRLFASEVNDMQSEPPGGASIEAMVWMIGAGFLIPERLPRPRVPP